MTLLSHNQGIELYVLLSSLVVKLNSSFSAVSSFFFSTLSLLLFCTACIHWFFVEFLWTLASSFSANSTLLSSLYSSPFLYPFLSILRSILPVFPFFFFFFFFFTSSLLQGQSILSFHFSKSFPYLQHSSSTHLFIPSFISTIHLSLFLLSSHYPLSSRSLFPSPCYPSFIFSFNHLSSSTFSPDTSSVPSLYFLPFPPSLGL